MKAAQPSSRPPDSKGTRRANFVLALATLAFALVPVNCALSAMWSDRGRVTEVEFLIFCAGFVLGLSAWLMANRDLRKIREGIIPTSARRTTELGKKLGVSATILNPTLSVLVVFLVLFTYSGVPKDALIDDLNNLFADAHEYRIRPDSLGGGGGAYAGYRIPAKLSSTGLGVYTATVLHADTIEFEAKWIQDTTTTITVKIGPDGRSIEPWVYRW